MIPQKRSKQNGQGLVEYAMSILLIIVVFGVINRSILKGVGRMWQKMATEIAAGCPDCKAPEQLQ